MFLLLFEPQYQKEMKSVEAGMQEGTAEILDLNEQHITLSPGCLKRQEDIPLLEGKNTVF